AGSNPGSGDPKGGTRFTSAQGTASRQGWTATPFWSWNQSGRPGTVTTAGGAAVFVKTVGGWPTPSRPTASAGGATPSDKRSSARAQPMSDIRFICSSMRIDYLFLRYSIRSLTPTPVAPLGEQGRDFSLQAVPAISRCA